MRLRPPTPIVFLFALLAATGGTLRANDAIFPAQPAAAKAIGWKDGYFLIDGKPQFIASAEVHYARIPRELWRERIWRLKMMGMNTVSTYVFWNAQEGREGDLELDDNKDLDAWLTLVQQMGMFAIVRPGPYNCAEWEHGGFPAWLTVKPGMEIRNAFPAYLKAVDAYWNRLLPIIAKHQINRGGSVLMVQLENEHPKGWGTDQNDYLEHLYQTARAAGLEVPLFFSGLHHGRDPAGEKPFGKRDAPWFTTEFWTGWIAKYGEMDPGQAKQVVRGTWKIIAFGGAGYTYYVAHGGSNFGYTRGAEEGAAYDYSAPIGQAGQLREVFYPLRRATLFATTFSDLLAHSVGGAETREGIAGGLRLLPRSGPEGTAVFLDNDKGSAAIETKVTLKDPAITFPTKGMLRLEPREIRAVALLNVPWTKNVTMEAVVAGVLGRRSLGNFDYWVLYGRPGETGEVTVRDARNVRKTVAFQYPADDKVREIPIPSSDGRTAVLLVMNTATTDRTWLLDDAIYIGPHFVFESGAMEFSAATGGEAAIYSATGRRSARVPGLTPPPLPELKAWTWRDAAPEAAVASADAKWLSSPEPRPMETYDSFQNGYGWYRASFTSPGDRTVALKFPGSAGDLRVFLNGEPADLARLAVKRGTNTLAILAMTTPRSKLYKFIGPTGSIDSRGVWGKPSGGDGLDWSAWRFHGGLAGLDETPLVARVTNWESFLAGEWKATAAKPDWPSFWRADFEMAAPPGFRQTIGIDAAGLERGQVWVNGHNLGPVPDKHPIYIPECWLQPKNTIVIFDAKGAKPDAVKLMRYEAWVGGKG